MVNHLYNELTDATLCGEYSGVMAREISSEWNPSCPECVDSDPHRNDLESTGSNPVGDSATEPLKGSQISDPVNSPAHYRWLPVEAIEITELFNFCLGNALKYILRADHKGKPVEDLEKAVWYLTREIEMRKRDTP